MNAARSGARRAPEGGFTLIETLLASVISLVVIIPLLAWIITSMRADVSSRDTSVGANAVGALRISALRDVPSASAISLPPFGPGSCGSSQGSVLVALQTAGANGTRWIAYVAGTADASWRSGGRELLRVVCDGSSTPSVEIVASPVYSPPTGWSSAARCLGTDCGSLELVLGRPNGGSLTPITASRRLAQP